MPQTFVLPKQVGFLSGLIAPSSVLRFYQTGTSTPQNVYTDAALTNAVTSITADSAGVFAKVYLNPNAAANYRVTLENSVGAVSYTEDDIDRQPITQAAIGAALYPTSAAESAAGITPTNKYYPYGHVYRYGTNTTPGTTDMTTAINNAATVCRQGKYTLRLPEETCFVTSTLDFDLIRVEGPTADMAGQIQASSAQFNVISVKQSASFANFRVNGGWDGSTAGQTGDIFHIENTGGTGFAYNVHLHNITAQNAKQRLIYWLKGGYGSIYNFHGNLAGLHGLEIAGVLSTSLATTIQISGNTILSDTPNGYGAKLTQCASIHFNGVIMEETRGIQLNGADNRALTFENIYQEGTIGGAFITDNGSSGIGLTVKNCFGGNHSVPYLTNWENVYFQGNSNLTESAVTLTGRVSVNDSGELTTTTTGGVEVTVNTLSLSSGTWLIHATMQTITSTATTLTQAAIKLTTNVADSGLANSTGAGFVEGADEQTYNPGASLDLRCQAFLIYQNTTAAAVNMYLRGRLTFSGAGTLAYRGKITAVRLQ